jgi:transcriptional regulator with PAS, ATPase and Fis domain
MEFATRSPRMRALLEQAKRLARSEQTILLQGESGTGKERLARYIHAHSDRMRGPFIKVDCTTVPEGLWESNPAAGGTIFLDEIGNLPLSSLLRVLQSRRADLCVVAATNGDLSRVDLYDGLNVLLLTLPSLRERKEDIELLTGEILARQAGKGSAPTLTADAIAALLLYDWPGNERELANALQRAFLLAGPLGPIDVVHLPAEVAGNLQAPPPKGLFRRYMKSAELLLIRWALFACDNERTRAARFLGLSRAALYKKLKLYPEFGTQAGE